MTLMADAFEKAGLPSGAVAFAAACHDLARLALNREADPQRAVPVFLGMAGGRDFRMALESFIASVAAERAGSKRSVGAKGHTKCDTHAATARAPADPSTESDGVAGHGSIGTHDGGARLPSDLNPSGSGGHALGDAQLHHAPAPDGPQSDDGSGHALCDTHQSAAAPPSDPERERGGQACQDAHSSIAASLAPAGPTDAQMRAVTAAKAASARVMSGVFIPDHRGGKEAFDDLRIRYYEITEQRLARAVGRNSVAYNLIRIAKTRLPANHDQMPSTTSSSDVFSADEIRQMQMQAAVFAGSGLISLPEELRKAVTEAVA